MNWVEYPLFPDHGKWSLPAVSGVYAIYFDGVLSYIGQSNNIRRRFAEKRLRYGLRKNIHTPWGIDFPDTTRVSVKVKQSRRYGDWAMWEIRLINRLKPRFNTIHKGRRHGR